MSNNSYFNGSLIDTWRQKSKKSALRVNGIGCFFIYLALTALLIPPFPLTKFQDSLLALSMHYYPAFWWKDPAWYVWAYAWWPHALTHSLNPFISDDIWYPFHVNLAFATSIQTCRYCSAPSRSS